jgi:ketosteroid isomerase-like protein
MKIISSLFLTLMLVAVSFASINVVKAGDDIEDELEAMYAKIDKAVQAKDIDTLASLLSSDYEKRDGTKTFTRDEAVAGMKKNLDSVKRVESSKTVIDKIEQVEGNQIVDYTMTSVIVVADSEGKESSYTSTSKGRDWWVKGDDGKWLCVAAEKLD